MGNEKFQGFDIPKENWSKLPHELINILPLIETVGELKVVIYILRHTWGYHEFDEGKKITLDEFENGRVKRDRTRIDNGTGLSRPTIIDGLKRAVSHGIIEVEIDTRDKARVKKFYSLRIRRLNSFTPGEKSFNSESKDSLLRTEKDTLERNSREDIQQISEPEICPQCQKPKTTGPGIQQSELCTCDGEAELAAFLGEHEYASEVPEYLDPTPAQAGGSHGPAEAIIDGICRYNGLSRGIDAMADKDRESWVRVVAEICDRYWVSSVQARLAWRAYALRHAYKEQVSPFYRSFESELSPIMAAVRDGDITAASLEAEAAKGNGRKRQAQEIYKPPSQEQIESDRELLRQRHRERQAVETG